MLALGLEKLKLTGYTAGRQEQTGTTGYRAERQEQTGTTQLDKQELTGFTAGQTGYTAGQIGTDRIHSWKTEGHSASTAAFNSRNRCQTYRSRTGAKALLRFAFAATTGTEPVQLFPRLSRGYKRTGARPVEQDESLDLPETPLLVA